MDLPGRCSREPGAHPLPFLTGALREVPQAWHWRQRAGNELSPEIKFPPKPVKHPLVVCKGYGTAVAHISVLQWDIAEGQEATPQPSPLYSSHRQKDGIVGDPSAVLCFV